MRPGVGKRIRWLLISLAVVLAASACGVVLWARERPRHTTPRPALTIAIPPFSSGATSISLSPFGRAVAVGDDNGNIYLWDTSNGQRIGTLRDPNSGGVLAVAFPSESPLGGFGPYGATFAAGDGNGHVYLWNAATRQLTATFTDPHSKGVLAVAFTPALVGAAAGILAAGDGNGHVYLWNFMNGKLVATLTDPHAMGAWSVAFGLELNTDTANLAVRDQNGNTYLWDIASRRMKATFTGAASEFNPGVALYGDTLTTINHNGHVYLWSLATKRKTATFTYAGPLNLSFYGMAYDSGIIATNDCGGHVYLWSLAAKRKIATFTNPDHDSLAGVLGTGAGVAIAADGTVVADTNCDGYVYLWRLPGGG